MNWSNNPDGKESYGPEAALRRLEKMGLGDGLLAKAFRSALVKRPNGSLTIGSTFRGPEENPPAVIPGEADKSRT